MESGNSHSSILAEVFSEKLPAEGKNSRFRCECAYDGTDFCGWQSQKSGGSVQDFIEARLGQILKKPIRIHGSGRTDSGVHATGQVFHFDAVWDHPAYALLAALRSTNRTDVFVKSLKRVGNDFHARYSAKGKRYVYYIHTGVALPHLARYRWSLKGLKPDIDKMNAAAEALVGEHDFTAFSASRGANARENPVKGLRKLSASRRGAEIKIVAEGSGFMYKMVRMLVGALVDAGTGRLSKSDIEKILASKKGAIIFRRRPRAGCSSKRFFIDWGALPPSPYALPLKKYCAKCAKRGIFRTGYADRALTLDCACRADCAYLALTCGLHGLR